MYPGLEGEFEGIGDAGFSGTVVTVDEKGRRPRGGAWNREIERFGNAPKGVNAKLLDKNGHGSAGDVGKMSTSVGAKSVVWFFGIEGQLLPSAIRGGADAW